MTRRGGSGWPLWLLFGAGLLAAGLPRPVMAEPSGAFPNLEPWPQALGLGGIPIALGEGVEAVLENPTGMLVNPVTGLAFSHASLFTGGLVTHQAFAFCFTRRDDEVTWRNGTVYQGHGQASSAIGLGVTNLSGKLQGAESYGEIQIALSYARRVPLGLRAGFRLRILQSRSTVDAMGGSAGYAFDFGLEDRVLGCRIGFVANAVTSDVRWDRSLDGPIPPRFAVSIERDAGHGFSALAGTDLRSTTEPRRLSLAGRWQVPGTPLTLLAGPSVMSGDGESHAEISSGAEIIVGRLAAEYGMRTGPPGLGEIHRFGIRVAIP